MSFFDRLFAFLRSLFSFRPAPQVAAAPAPPPPASTPTRSSSKLGLTPEELIAKYSSRTSSATARPEPAQPAPVRAAPVIAKPAAAPAPTRSVESAFDFVGQRLGIPSDLLRAIATVESSYGRNLHSPGSPSYGIMQINCGSRPGWDDPCTRGLPRGFMREWPVTPRRLVTDHEYNIELGARLLKDGLRSFRGDWVRAIAAYNVGTPSVPRSGPIPVTVGAERPRDYVVRVLSEWRARGGPDLLTDPALDPAL